MEVVDPRRRRREFISLINGFLYILYIIMQQMMKEKVFNMGG